MAASGVNAEALVAENVTVRYGGVTALDDASLRVEPGAIVGLIGPNGAGKTTLINAITGVVRPTSGTIALGTKRLDRLPAHRVARAGIARTYQNVRLFARLDVADNVRAGAFARSGTLSDSEIVTLLERTGTTERDLRRRAGALPYGEQRRLEVARALAARPATLLLDEPAAGMNPAETIVLGRTIASVASSGVGILLVEHDMSLVAAICTSVVVLNFGRVIATGTPQEIARDPAVIEAYLGT